MANCIIRGGAAYYGGGVYQGSLLNCTVLGNQAYIGGGTYSSVLQNCTVLLNSGEGTYGGNLTNCIVYFNTGTRGASVPNYLGGNFSYCCTTPLPSGPGNISAVPQVLSDGIHLASTSPCLTAGTNLTTGGDIDSQPWSNPPSIGCDQWQPSPVCQNPPTVQPTVGSPGLVIGAVVAGQDPFVCWWTKDGVLIQNDGTHKGATTTNLVLSPLAPGDAGAYQLVATNGFGMVTSPVVKVVVHCVAAGSTVASAPYSNWTTAATNIQDAIDAALAGGIVLVTNGVYSMGGKIMGGDLLNRVALDKPLFLLSVNGFPVTTILGAWDPGTITGPLGVRCAWLTNGAVLSGFTLLQGATRALTTTPDAQQNGGGAYGASTNAVVLNCLIRDGAAGCSGGGACQLSLINCTLEGNSAVTAPVSFGTQYSGDGGGAFGCNLINCVVLNNFAYTSGGGAAYSTALNSALIGNRAVQYGGGVYFGTQFNCTISGNSVGGSALGSRGGGAYSANLANCILYGNHAPDVPYVGSSNSYNSVLAFSCTAPAASGAGNITADPQLLGDGVHLASTSPCRGSGTNIVTGTDIDGQPWANPPSIGSDEWQPAPALGGQIQIALGGIPLSATISGLVIAGQDPFGYWWLKDGATLDDGPLFSSTHGANLTVTRFGPEAAGIYSLIVSNAFGMATSAVAQVVVHCVDANGANPLVPYSTWASAATSVQDAIDAANAAEYVIVTNGVYATGGRVMAGDLTNRIAINKPLIVAGINGPQSAFIRGAYDPATTNGPLAVRCAWLAQGATLQGLTLLGGATRNSGDTFGLQSGGGAWCSTTNELLLGCILSNNMATSYGGGAYQGQLQRSVLWGNAASYGGAAYNAFLANSLVRSNAASFSGGGLHSSRFVNCTVTANLAPFNAGGGEWGSSGRNSIVFYNIAPGSFYQFDYNDWDLPSKVNLISCWTSAGNSPGVIPTPSPQFVVDGIHLAATSPCRGAGSAQYAFGTDLDGEPWLNPPSIGCDEFYDIDASGPLLVGPITAYALDLSTPVIQNTHSFVQTHVTGNANRVAWSFGDGTALTNSFTYVALHVWKNAGDYNVTFTAYNHDNPGGVTTNALIQVVPPTAPLLSGSSANGTNFVVSFATQADVNYVVEQTTNLTTPMAWQQVGTVYGTGRQARATDGNATNVMQFYRVRLQ